LWLLEHYCADLRAAGSCLRDRTIFLTKNTFCPAFYIDRSMEIRKILSGMKTLATLSLVSIFTSSVALAGGFGGPGPFRNDSPLPTGTDGTYNASLRGSNTSGIFRFSISAGTQSADILPVNPTAVGPAIYSGRNNSWVAWYEGIVYRGLTDAAIIEGNVSGVLDPMQGIGVQINPPPAPALSTVTEVTGPIVTTFPADPLVPQPGEITTAPYTSTSTTTSTTTITQAPAVPGPNAVVGGQFSGSINSNSPTGSMSGNGLFVVVENLGPVAGDGTIRDTTDPQFVSKEVKFRWRGARVNTGAN
jgi:hypothetical protein